MEEEWVPFSLTFVEYPKGDHWGHFLAVLSLVPISVIGVALPTLILFRRDLHTMYLTMGLLLNEAVNYVTKKTLRHPRPTLRKVHYNENGMPSSHAQLICFLALYLLLFIWLRLHRSPSPSFVEWAWKILASVISLLVAILVCVGRVYLQYHTLNQVLVGSVLGATLGAGWFGLLQGAVGPFIFPRLASWPVAQALLVRDTSSIPHLLSTEHQLLTLEVQRQEMKRHQ
ncbi:unnamed protein product [Cyprideis torosa]|uniref:Dolichyldiphosphatase n=1 Tax=Cyprideis torosa TaxID=163714 RepID=A0A7R8ZHQ2_9CRUS|nr:unnamed protein product [Cyprideis torosa]CAG0883014.1 unnamed protein product [Cyprideis torosa]